MKRFIKNILLLGILPLISASCVHDDDYDAPKTGEGVGQTLEPNTDIPSIQAFAGTTAALYETNSGKYDGIVEGYVISSDASGNIYKNIYIVSEDGKTGLQLSVNRSNLYNFYPLGSKVYVKLDSTLYVGKQYNMTMIGTAPTQPDRYVVDQIPSGLISSQIILSRDEPKKEDDLVIKTNASGNPLTVKDLDDSYLNTLVEISNASFADAGSAFVRGNVTTDNNLIGTPTTNPNVNVDVRVSNYAEFANYPIPYGTGKVRGVFTKYVSGSTTTYQLLIRSDDDIKDFSGDKAVFTETFNKVTDADGNAISTTVRPKIGVATGFDNGAPVTYSDASGWADVRSTAAINPHVWLPANQDSYLTISGINTSGYHDLKLVYYFLSNGVTNTNKLIVRCNGVELTVPSVNVSPTAQNSNNYVIVSLPDDIPSADSITLEFYAKASDNTVGFRLDNIMITGTKN